MSVLTWEDVDYEVGVDRGVVFLDAAGYVWNGLVSVDEDSNVETKSLFLDGANYLSVVTGRYFSAQVSAITVPKGFLPCLGLDDLAAGIRLSRQPKRRFNFSYRTKKANGYNLHLVYNCLATSDDKDHQTIGDSTEPEVRSWTFNATPSEVAGVFRPTAHFIVDSERVDPEVLNDIENLIYGTPSTTPDFPTVDELLAYFGDYG